MKTKSPANETDLEPDWKAMKPAFQVFIAYGDLAAGQRALRVLSTLSKGCDKDIEFCPLPWSFDMLTHTNWRDTAASGAGEADILMIATSNTRVLPTAVEKWVEGVLGKKREKYCVIVALCGPEKSPAAAAQSSGDWVSDNEHETG